MSTWLAPQSPSSFVLRDRPWGQAIPRPEILLVLLSLVYGVATIFVNPPLRGPDEAAHFLRAYGIVSGDIVPSTADEQRRRGVFLPANLHDGFRFFEGARYKVGTLGFSYHQVLRDYTEGRSEEVEEPTDRQPTFIVYQGSESYSPVAYLPFIAAAAMARLFDLDFAATLYLMRFAGLGAMTAVAAYAIAMTPHLKWAFFFIAMLPTALYSRAVVSADGAVVSYTLLVAALCLKVICTGSDQQPWRRSAWMTLCVMTKPSQIVFVLLETMTAGVEHVRGRWRTAALVVLPGVVLTALWILATSGDVGAWRMTDGGRVPPEQFDPVWKLQFMLEHPLYFPKAVLTSLDFTPELWRQLIGVLGWLDVDLQGWVYPTLTVLFTAVCLERLALPARTRAWIAAVSGLVIVGYILTVFLIFFLTWSPTDSPRIEGVQGRYFIAALPSLAIPIAALVNWAPRQTTVAALAIVGAVLSAAATIEATLRVHW